MKKPFDLSVGSLSEYEELIAEIMFPGKFGFIVSQESGEGRFELSAHSFRPAAAQEFDVGRSVPESRVSLDDLNTAIKAAVSELTRLKRG